MKVNMGYLVSILVPLYFIFVDTKLCPICKEIVFIVAFLSVIYFMINTREFVINKIIFYNFILFLSIFTLIPYWGISQNEYLLFLYRKFQYIFMMMFPLLFFVFNKDKKILYYLNIGMSILLLFLILNILFNISSLKIGAFQGILLSRPGAGVLALLVFIYFLYVKINFQQNSKHYFLLILSFVIAIFYIVYTGSKTAGFGMVVLFGLFIIRNFKFSVKQIFLIFMSLVFFFLFVPLTYFTDLIRFYNADELSSSIQRFIEWNIAIDIIKEHWFLGVGWKEYANMINNNLYSYGSQMFPLINWKYITMGGDSSSQNVLLDNIAIYGILGIIYNIFIIYILWIVYKIDTLKSYILLFLVILLMTNNFNFGNGYELIFWFLVSLILLKKEILKKGKI